MTPPTAVSRTAARVLLLDARDRLLLFRGGDPHQPERGTFWFTPGGGLDPGESLRDGAVRELFEETGLRCDPADLVGPVHAEETDFEFAGLHIRQHSTFFVLRIEAHEVDISGFQELEASSIVEHRWWDLADLAVTTEPYYPRALVAVLDAVA